MAEDKNPKCFVGNWPIFRKQVMEIFANGGRQAIQEIWPDTIISTREERYRAEAIEIKIENNYFPEPVYLCLFFSQQNNTWDLS